MKKIISLSLFAVLGFVVNTEAQTITTIAGTGVAGFNGDSSYATAARIYGPVGVAVDGAGNSYFADYYNQRIRKINSAGTISTIAGTGTAGYSGDNGLAVDAQLNNPMGVAVDIYGNVYVADKGNHRVRMINTNGIITTLAGANTFGYTGDNGPASAATLYAPTGVAVDHQGNVYIADRSNNAVRKISTDGMITTIAGTGAQGFNGDDWPSSTLATLYTPSSVAVDKIGNVYIADQNNNRIRKVDTFGKISTVMGNGVAGYTADGVAAAHSQIYAPSSVAVDKWGNVYISDELNYMIRKMNINSGQMVTIAGSHGVRGFNGDTGLAINALIGDCKGLAVDDAGNIYLSDWRNNRVNYITSTVTAVMNVNAGLQSLAIYPNPNNGSVTVNVASVNSGKVNIVITNVVGEKIKEVTTETNRPFVVDMNVAAGIYFVSATTANGHLAGKIEVSGR